MWHMDKGRVQHRTNSARRGADEALSGCELHSTPPLPPKKILGFFSQENWMKQGIPSTHFSLAATKGL